MSKWKSIDTAPLDGTRILLFDADRYPNTLIATADRHARGWWGDATPSGKCIVWGDATHWMPIPKPPND